MNARPIRTRLGRGLAVVIAGSVVGVAGALRGRPTSGHPVERAHQADREAIAEWAKANESAGCRRRRCRLWIPTSRAEGALSAS